MALKPLLREQRSFGRRTTVLHASIVIEGRAPIPCIVQNVSEGGALIAGVERHLLPMSFALLIASTGEHHRCEIKHARRDTIGVEFVTRAPGAIRRK